MWHIKASKLGKIVACAVFPFLLQANPAAPWPITVEQPDGSKLAVRQRGDEHFHFTTTEDGYTIAKSSDGFYYYLENENLELSKIRANNANLRGTEELSFLNSIDKEKQYSILLKQAAQKRKQAQAASSQETHFPTTGSPKALVILVNFRNEKFESENPKADFTRLLNEEGYSENGALGSCRDYYMENSRNMFQPEFDVYGPATLAYGYEHYGDNSIATGDDIAPGEMVIEACRTLDNEIDFSEYDTDNDGMVDNIYVFYAGYGESDSNQEKRIWPHSYNVEEENVVLDGVRLGRYACSNEVNFATKQMNGIGTFAHEFGHVLGLPDIYSTRYVAGAFTPGEWCLMDYGSYNNNGNTPPYMTVFERYSLGWMQPKELSKPANIILDTLENGDGYIIKTNREEEYFLLENRQQSGWDQYVPGHGMLVWHIDYNAAIWAENAVNNDPNHQYVDIEEADGLRSYETMDGDPFPGSTGKTSITDDTQPSMRTWAGLAFGKDITDITETEGKIHFRFMGGETLQTPPVANEATDITKTSFTAHWTAVENATGYNLDVYSREEGAIIYADGYQSLATGNVTSFTVTDLEAGKDYYYRVRATDKYSETGNSNEIAVRTLDPTFDMLAPTALPADAVTDNSFTAKWSALSEAKSYSLSVYTKERTKPTDYVVVDFTDGIEAMPEGWTTTSSSTMSMTGYYGTEAPSLSINTDNGYLQSPVFDSEINTLEFWMRSRGDMSGSALSVLGYNGKKWDVLSSINEFSSTEGKIITVDADLLQGIYAIRLLFSKASGGSIAIDDVEIGYGGSVNHIYLPGWDKQDVGNTTSSNVTGLQPGTTYYYTVGSNNGDIDSDTSNEIKVTTTGNAAIHQLTAAPRIWASGKELHVCPGNGKPACLTIYNTAGMEVMSKNITEDTCLSLRHLPAGIYFVRMSADVIKIML